MCKSTSKPQIIVDIYTFASGRELASLSMAKSHGTYVNVEILRQNFLQEFIYRYRTLAYADKQCDVYITAFYQMGIPCMDVRAIPVGALLRGECPAPVMQFRFTADYDAIELINEYFSKGIFGYDLKNSRIVARLANDQLAF